MPIYFRGPEALITHRAFIRIRPQTQEFAIGELRHPHIVIAEAKKGGPRFTHPARRLTRRHSYEVHADYHGRRVCLFQTTDPRLFGQIRRALVRALETHAKYGSRP